MKKGIIIGLLASVLILSFASIAFAFHTGTAHEAPVVTPEKINTLVGNVINFIFTVLLIGAAIFIIIAAFQFLTGGGDAEQLTQARGKIIWAGVAIVVAFLARGLPTVFENILNVGVK